MPERLCAVRGATGARNTAESVRENVCEMCLRIFAENNLSQNDIVSIQFTVTSDLRAMNPAAALRTGQSEFDVSSVPFFCSQEPEIDGAPERMIRVLVTAYMPEGRSAVPVYINGGERLRPDLKKK